MSNFEIVDKYRATEITLRTLLASLSAEYYRVMVLLTPLDKATLEVGFGLINLFERDALGVDLVDEQAVSEVVSLVEVYCSHHRLESVTKEVFLRSAYGVAADDEFIESEFAGYGVE